MSLQPTRTPSTQGAGAPGWVDHPGMSLLLASV